MPKNTNDKNEKKEPKKISGKTATTKPKKETTSKKALDIKENKVVKKVVKEEVQEKEQKIEKEKSTKNVYNLAEVVIVMIITAMVSLMVGSIITYVLHKDEIQLHTSTSKDEGLSEFVSLYDEIVDEYYSTVDKNTLIRSAIQGMVGSLGDEYSNFLDSSSADELNQTLEGGFVGIGIEITYTNDEDQNIVVYNVYENSPAAKAGLKSGDIIQKIDTTEVQNYTLENLAKLVQNGKEGTKVEVTVLRDGQTMTLTILRGFVELESVSGSVLEKNNKKVGYIAISAFAKNSYIQFERVYRELEKEGMDALVLDVRGNTGGYLATAKDIASMFLNKGDIVYQVESKGKKEHIYSNKNKEITVPVAILTNTVSASASEVLAAALQENIGAIVVGTRTYGKGTVQKVKQLTTGDVVKYTTQNWLTPKGNTIEGIGVKPDIEVTLDKEYLEDSVYSKDNQLQTAMDALTK